MILCHHAYPVLKARSLQRSSVAQSVERFHGKEEVAGSIPVGSTITYGPLVKWFNTAAFHAVIQGFESPTGHHMEA